MKAVINWILKNLAHAYVKVKKIEVVAITGSAGKTTAKMALGHIFASDKNFYIPVENYNTETGIPLSIFGLKNPENTKNILSWIRIILLMGAKFFEAKIYRTIVLEYGADRPGDIDYLKSIAKPHVAVVTAVLPSHLEGFGSIEAIAKEKGSLVRDLTPGDFAILNFDNEYSKKMARETRAHVVGIGQDEGADLRYSKLKFSKDGMVFGLSWKDEMANVNMQMVAPQLLPSILAAVAAALIYGKDLKKTASKLADFVQEKGRMRLFSGADGETIIDDSYNSSPEAAKEAVRVLAEFSGRRIAVLGSMNELGDYSEKAHEELGRQAAKKADIVIAVGETASEYLFPVAKKALGDDKVYKFNGPFAAGEFLKDFVQKGDVVLFKGSQNGVLLEEAIKYLLPEGTKYDEVLVRQSKMWENKKQEFRRKLEGKK